MKPDDVHNMRLWNKELAAFRQRYGLEAYKVVLETYNADQSSLSAMKGYSGNSSAVTPIVFCHPYHVMVEQFRYLRMVSRSGDDKLASGSWKSVAAEKFNAEYVSWKISWHAVNIKEASGEQKPGIIGEHGSGHISIDIAVSPTREIQLRNVAREVDNLLILDLRNKRNDGEFIVGDAIVLSQTRSGGSFVTKQQVGHLAWLPDAVNESIAFSAAGEAVAVRTSRGRMVRFIDKKIKGE